ncbi:tumor necrosis factor receptor superfamily member 6B isoform X2 [Antechinus flavipes]|uniref:tumor necrosis factor receptor superfamily member 6B isoform X2 n=1 Tax=Antechinus flavipes TaxID=38775 RepID=UPI002236B545|nr:tumor necrosis factor receptor superfamily member 6B isoform X2 [Antechinus flavipes]
MPGSVLTPAGPGSPLRKGRGRAPGLCAVPVSVLLSIRASLLNVQSRPRVFTVFCHRRVGIPGAREESLESPFPAASPRRVETFLLPEFGFSQNHGSPNPARKVFGTPTQNTQCQPCPKGTFSDNSSSTERCQPHRNCTTFGMFLNVPGTSFHDTMCTRCASFLSSTPEPGNKECEKAVIDFVAFQNISLKRLRKLQQALETPDSWQTEWPEPENRAAVQKELLHRLTELSDPQESSIFVPKLLQALRKAKLTTLEKNLRKRFLLDLKD